MSVSRTFAGVIPNTCDRMPLKANESRGSRLAKWVPFPSRSPVVIPQIPVCIEWQGMSILWDANTSIQIGTQTPHFSLKVSSPFSSRSARLSK